MYNYFYDFMISINTVFIVYPEQVLCVLAIH